MSVDPSSLHRNPYWAPDNPGYKSLRLKLIEPNTLQGHQPPERPWLVPGWIPMLQTTMLSGDGGQGKTLLLQQLMTACATGRDWLGMPMKTFRTLGVFCEDDRDELWRRQCSINQSLGIDFDALDNMAWISRIGLENSLMNWRGSDNPGTATEFFQTLHNAAQDFGAQLIVLDSLHDLFPGNENIRTQVRQFIQLLTSLARDCDGAVVLSAHPSVAGRNSGTGESGSTAWNNSVRSRLYLSRPTSAEYERADPDLRELSIKKLNYGSADKKFVLRWQDGAFVPEQGAATSWLDTSAAANRVEDTFIRLLQRYNAEGQHVSPNPSNTYAPTRFAKDCDATGITRRAFEVAMQGLLKSGRIKVNVEGPPSKQRKRLIVVVEGEP